MPAGETGSTRRSSSRMNEDRITSTDPWRHAAMIFPGMLAGYAMPDNRTFVSSTTRNVAIPDLTSLR